MDTRAPTALVSQDMTLRRPRRLMPFLILLPALLALGLWAPGAESRADEEREEAERYPATFRMAVAEAIKKGVAHIASLQKPEGHWGAPDHRDVMGHTALSALTMLKAGIPADDPRIVKAFESLEPLPMTRVYSVACYLMALHAKYQPSLDTIDTDVGADRNKRLAPKDVRDALSEGDEARIEEALAFLIEAQTGGGLWHYDIRASGYLGFDLSCTQYGLLGLRAAMDCGFKVKAGVWRDALRALVKFQADEGPEIELYTREVSGGYVIEHREKAQARGFRYDDNRKDGPRGEKTVPTRPLTGSMTTAGVAAIVICTEGLWRSRRFSGRDRSLSKAAVRDGLAWMSENWSVTTNPGREDGAHHLYYLYGLERMGMLVGRRWIGEHDWYKEGADHLLEKQNANGGWGGFVATSFAVLFLKRATQRSDTVVTTGD